MPIGDLLPEIVLLLGAVTIVLFAAFTPQRLQRWSAVLALIALALAAWFSVLQWGAPPRLTFSGVWALDGVAVAAKLLILFSGAVVVALSPDWMRSDRRHGEYYALCLFSLLGMIMMASANDAMELVVGVLLSSAASYPLAAYHRGFPPALEAAMKYFLIGALANALLVIGVVILFGLVGDTDYAKAANVFQAGTDSIALSVAVACIVLGLTYKLGAVPAHAWMPDVAQGAPAPIAAFLTVAPKIGAAVALARFLTLLPQDLAWPGIIALISVATMTLGNLAALRQTDLRRLLGWSSVSQSGYMLMAIVVVGSGVAALPALLAFLVAYALANLLAFAVVTHLRGRTEFEHYHGLSRRQPLATAALIVSLLSLVGIPPLVGFFGKFLLFEVTIEAGYTWLAVVAAINTVVSLYYYLRVIALTMFKTPQGEVHTLGGWSWVALLTTLILLILASLGFQWLIEMLGPIGFAG
ncbi:NADH-quinone oxidoreductase subunit N [Pistricoccus aurantiacus]|uniref:NADH-quinone oxidoreductase subunit N n=1 Tax=Pistricoccus aurantiacus TaxID=1883414 RepID=A0A5B8SNJ5_9GAMM|nr:NADH-quinone oxidoreductase subunit N [Pistricoccus aurantiacus]QEA37627.1 NADH-quinone oxidoreductase subunit N [Pistricoccus aurantiacus]